MVGHLNWLGYLNRLAHLIWLGKLNGFDHLIWLGHLDPVGLFDMIGLFVVG